MVNSRMVSKATAGPDRCQPGIDVKPNGRLVGELGRQQRLAHIAEPRLELKHHLLDDVPDFLASLRPCRH